MSILSKTSDVIFFDETFYKTLLKENPDVLEIVPNVPSVFVYDSYCSVKQGEYGRENIIKLNI